MSAGVDPWQAPTGVGARELRERLRAAAGPTAVEEIDGVSLEGARLETRVRPCSGEDLAGVLQELNTAGAAALVRGGGSRLGLGHPVPRARVLLETAGLAAPPIVDAEDGVAYLPAGAALSDLREHVRKEAEGRWELPLDPPGAGSTLGGCLAAAATGPRHGPPRDVVLGLDITLGTAERTRCGGRVVKNVTGYDLAKLYVGSLGTLGVIETAWIRLRPSPERREVWLAGLEDLAGGLASSRRSSVSAALWVDRAGSARLAPWLGAERAGSLLVVELAGDAAAVEADGAALREEIGAEPVPEGEPLIAALRDLLGEDRGLRFQLSSLPSRLSATARRLAEHGAELLVQPARGTLVAHFLLAPEEGEAAVERAFRGVRLAAAEGEGRWRVEAAPLEVRSVRDAFGEDEALIPVFRALKRVYDPRGVLGPGRQAGRV